MKQATSEQAGRSVAEQAIAQQAEQGEIKSVLLVAHHAPRARESVAKVAEWWDAQGVTATIKHLEDLSGQPGTGQPSASQSHSDAGTELLESEAFDIAISLGGDGTMLHAVRLVGDADVPVLGINFGKLGYLAEAEADDAIDALRQVQAGEYSIEKRMRLSVCLKRATGERINLGGALNEVVLLKQQGGHTVHLKVFVDAKFFTTYVADGIIAATPTGSTAYSMSARGPIVAPSHEAIILTPVAPHMIFDRALVLSPDAKVEAEILEGQNASSATDGKNGPDLIPGDSIVCERSAHPARLITFKERDFLGVLKEKFDLNHR